METEIAALPDDALANVLRRLPPRSLAAGRSVCKTWRSIVDDRALLPLRVHGIFINYVDHDRPHLFARPTTRGIVDGLLGFMPNDARRDWWSVLDHCNGLLLCHIRWERDLCVCNPMTRRWTLLPGNAEGSRYAGAYLVFDPAISPHYEVFLIPIVPEKPRTVEKRRGRIQQQEMHTSSFHIGEVGDREFQQVPSVKNEDMDPSNDTYGLMEWPPTPWKMNVFSSRTGRWEDRDFIRDGEPAGMVKDMWKDRSKPTWFGPRRRYAVHLQGALYVHCRGNFVARLVLSDGKYQVIKMPAKIEYAKPYLGRSEKGLCFGIFHECQIRVWVLTESCGNMEWVLKYQDDLGYYAIGSPYNNGKPMEGPWTVEEDRSKSDNNAESLKREGVEWDSDNDDILSLKIEDEQSYREDLDILGFHPYKEVVYLARPFGVVAYHLNSSKAQYLGNSRPDCYYRNHSNGIYESFVYTPSLKGELHEGNTEEVLE